jgi:hypothetical protein
MTTPTIRQNRGWVMGMRIPLLNLLPALNGGVGFSLSNATPHTQAGLRFNRSATPVFSLIFTCYSGISTFL